MATTRSVRWRRGGRGATGAGLLALALVLVGVPLASQPAEAYEPGTVSVDFSYGSLEASAGLSGTFGVVLRNLTAAQVDDVYVTFSADPGDAGLVRDTSRVIDPDDRCSQPGGAGADVVCGPYSLAAGAGRQVHHPYVPPSDYVIAQQGAPLVLTATASAPAGVPVSAPVQHTASVRTFPYQAARIMDLDQTVTSPGTRSLRLRVINGSYADITASTVRWLIPAPLTVRSVPTRCTAEPVTDAGQYLDCELAPHPWGTAWHLDVGVAVPAGIADGTRIPLPTPEMHGSSPFEPAPGATSWEIEAVGSPYVLVVEGIGEPEPEPTGTPEPTPSPEPTPEPTDTPEPTPSPEPTPDPSPAAPEPSPGETATPSPDPAPEPDATAAPTPGGPDGPGGSGEPDAGDDDGTRSDVLALPADELGAGSGASLARTGADAAPLAAAGAALVLVGVTLAFVHRRRTARG